MGVLHERLVLEYLEKERMEKIQHMRCSCADLQRLAIEVCVLSDLIDKIKGGWLSVG